MIHCVKLQRVACGDIKTLFLLKLICFVKSSITYKPVVCRRLASQINVSRLCLPAATILFQTHDPPFFTSDWLCLLPVKFGWLTFSDNSLYISLLLFFHANRNLTKCKQQNDISQYKRLDSSPLLCFFT